LYVLQMNNFDEFFKYDYEEVPLLCKEVLFWHKTDLNVKEKELLPLKVILLK
jgi:hypothetical protein